MIIKLSTNEEDALREQAAAYGFTSVEDYVIQLIRQRSTILSPRKLPTPLKDENERNRIFNDLVTNAKSRNPHVDDSRDSIYD